MIYTCVLLCVLTVPFAYTLKAQQYFTDHELNEESDGEVISIEHSIHKRSIPELSLYVKRNGSNRKYTLQSSEGFFAGKKTKVWLAKKRGEKFSYVLRNDIMDKVNLTFYHNRKTRSVIAHSVNEDGISEFNGIIDSDKVIRSLNNVKRFRRDVSSKSMHESAKNYHVLYKREVSPIKSGNINYSPNSIHDHDYLKNIKVTPKIVYPEILIYVDTTIFLHFNSSIEKTVAYVLIYWNIVDLYFRELDDPSVRLSIAGIVICEDPIEPMDKYTINGTSLKRFANFMFHQTNFKFPNDYDIAVFVVNPGVPQKTDGITFIEVCGKEEEYIYSVAITQDSGIFSGILTSVHEIGHLLGSRHDNNEKMTEAEIERCAFKKGFIMSYHKVNENKFFFSPCSKEQMKLMLSSEKAKCVWNNPAVGRIDDQMLTTFPGQHISADEQCTSYGFERALISPRICVKLECVKHNTKFNLSNSAFEGTPCDVKSVCLREKCVKLLSDRNDRNSDLNLIFPNHFQPYKSNKSLEEQCSERGILNIQKATLSDCQLHCQGTSSKKSLLNSFHKPDDGTVCRNNGYCLDGICYDALYKLAEKQCINFGASSFLKKSVEECFLVCKTTRYDFPNVFNNLSFHYYDDTFTTLAPDGFPCNNNGYCSNGKCITIKTFSKWNIPPTKLAANKLKDNSAKRFKNTKKVFHPISEDQNDAEDFSNAEDIKHFASDLGIEL